MIGYVPLDSQLERTVLNIHIFSNVTTKCLCILFTLSFDCKEDAINTFLIVETRGKSVVAFILY